MSLSLDLQMNQPEITGHIDFSGQVKADLDTQQFQANKLNLKVTAQGTGLPASPVDAHLLANVHADFVDQVININTLNLETLGASLSGQVDIKELDKLPTARGQIKVANVPKSGFGLLPKM